MSEHTIPWADEVAGKDYVAAIDLLSLTWDEQRASVTVAKLREAPIIQQAASDLVQAAGFDPLPLHDPGVLRELRKLVAGKDRSPILCVRQPDRIVIADGHHRLSLAYQLDPDAPVSVQLA